MMAAVVLLLFAVYFAVAFGWRTWAQYRDTGDSGFRGISGRVGSVEWTGGVLFVVALVAAVAAPIADLAGMPTIGLLDHRPVQIAGVVFAVVGIGATFAAQLAMGTSWRVGVDKDERTELVTTGPFSLARNPIFTAMAVTGLGLVLVVPNAVGVGGLIGLVAALQIQVRGVEEPYLARQHGGAWSAYSSHVGRFLPGIGLIRSVQSSGSRAGTV